MSELADQLKEIKELLKEDQGNHELLAVAKQLEEAIKLTCEKTPSNPLIGKTCEVPFEDSWLSAKIISITNDTARVQFLSQPITNEYPLSSLRVLQALDRRFCNAGAKLQGIWEGNWYDCEVIATRPDGYLVAFDGFKERIEIRADHLKKRISKVESPKKIYITPAGYRIPNVLKIEVNDTEKMKEEKKRKIHIFPPIG